MDSNFQFRDALASPTAHRRRYPHNRLGFLPHLLHALATIARFGGRVVAGGGKIDL
jgi:hypothetical protein